MDLRVAMWADIESILDRISDQHRAEYEKIGFPSEGFNLRLLHFMMAGDTHCIWFDGKPQCFMSVAPVGDVVTTWVGVTKECFDKGIGPLRLGRRHMADAVRRRGKITSYVASEHPKVAQWMKLLGARQIDATVFEFACP
ncbi:hypothetical protein [Mesorhizobium sp. M0139]|uniref:hypothetical protein n=1 Tax=Mesorhizobium sp. M0139 TaxID=2956892 RepID=UPI00333D9B00